MNKDIKYESTDLRPQYSKVTMLLTAMKSEERIGSITFDGPETSSITPGSLCGPAASILPIKDGLKFDIFEFKREVYPDKPFVSGIFLITGYTANGMTGELTVREGGIETIRKDITFTQVS